MKLEEGETMQINTCDGAAYLQPTPFWKKTKVILDEHTYIGGNKWQELKLTCMKDDIFYSDWWIKLSEYDRILVIELRKLEKELKKVNQS